ncbi:AAA family ATPase [Pluralibacter gergoviae]|uniref:AAA family ATPase n=1 Tax=Pluralibacter gergoviae TaxID=61647 RepID=UPI0008DBFCC7|nr:AAA family ATPase [Pluralibacter gergoviae]EKW6619604.1 deoxynucleoside kinase [Pluralibacter gergoviae]OHY58041.1 hypothetical protein BB778_06895 [Pluralibacter gergoviae]
MKEDFLIVALEGPSFSGKTILVNRRKMHPAFIIIPEYYEINNNLSLAGDNPRRDTLGQMEVFFKLMTFECQRQQSLKEAILEEKNVILDRTFFSLLSYEYARYESRNTWKKISNIIEQCEFTPPQLILYIDTPAEEVKRRGVSNGMKEDHIMLNKEFIDKNRVFFLNEVSRITMVELCTYKEADNFINTLG